MTSAYIGIGANLGDPIAQMIRALEAMDSICETQVTQRSGLYRSSPLGPQDQPDFVNACARLETTLGARELLEQLQRIEQSMGRVKHRHWGERCIDLDLLLFGDEVYDLPEMTIPHPGIGVRDFVLRPLMDITDASFVLPQGLTIAQALEQCGHHDLFSIDHPQWTHGPKGLEQ